MLAFDALDLRFATERRVEARDKIEEHWVAGWVWPVVGGSEVYESAREGGEEGERTSES